MTMLEIMKTRLPENLTLVKAKEKSARYDLVFELDGKEVTGSLPKTCTPGAAENVVDFTICAVMMHGYLEMGNLERVKVWKDKQDALVHLK